MFMGSADFRLLVLAVGATVFLGNHAHAQAWVADASKATPPAKPAAGQIKGSLFHLQKATLSSIGTGSSRVTYFLKLREGKDSFTDREFVIVLTAKKGDSLVGKRYLLGPEGAFKMAGVIKDGSVSYPPVQGVSYSYKKAGKDRPETEMGATSTMRLEFTGGGGDRLKGSIYLCFGDGTKTVLAGTFVTMPDR